MWKTNQTATMESSIAVADNDGRRRQSERTSDDDTDRHRGRRPSREHTRNDTHHDDLDHKRERDLSNEKDDKRRKHHKREIEKEERKRRKRSESDDSDREERRRRRRHKKQKKSSSRSRKSKSKKRRDYSSSSESSSESSSSSSDEDPSSSQKVINKRLLEKLKARGETLEERRERRAQKRADKISARFGYTSENNPFNDPNLHETFTWKKKIEKKAMPSKDNHDTLEEIENIRRRREERERERDEMERLKAQEARMKELEHYDDWARKEEEFHLQQQRQRSAIRLVEGREKPVDVLAKNLLLFGLSGEEKKNRASVKYQEKYNALNELGTLEAELEEPFKLLRVMKLEELQELMVDIDAFRTLEREAMSADANVTIMQYWDSLRLLTEDEIKLIQNGGSNSPYARKLEEISKIFVGLSRYELIKMKDEVEAKLRTSAAGAAYGTDGGIIDRDYWTTVLNQLNVHLAKMDLSELHSKMLVRQLENLEQRKEELQKQRESVHDSNQQEMLLSFLCSQTSDMMLQN